MAEYNSSEKKSKKKSKSPKKPDKPTGRSYNDGSSTYFTPDGHGTIIFPDGSILSF